MKSATAIAELILNCLPPGYEVASPELTQILQKVQQDAYRDGLIAAANLVKQFGPHLEYPKSLDFAKEVGR